MATGENVDLVATRGVLQTIHNELRNRGLNPVEAAAELARRVREDRESYGLSDGEALATAFQQFLTAEARSGLGQYFTPAPVCDGIAHFASQLANEPRTVLDPFCGAGVMLERVGQAIPAASMHGIEINRAVAEMSRTLEAVSHRDVTVSVGDSFERWAADQIDQVDLVATNPPFGATVTSGDLVGAGSPLPESLRSMTRIPAELAGLELSLAATRPGGHVAIVLPWSVLSNGRWNRYRADLFERARLVGALGLPDATFSPFRGVARSLILFLERAAGGTGVVAPWARSTSIGYDANGRAEGVPDVTDAIDHMRSAAENLVVETDGAVRLPPVRRSDRAAQPGKYVRLGDVADVFNGSTPAKSKMGVGGAFVLKVGDLSTGFVSWRSRGGTSNLAAGTRLSTSKALAPGDICLTAAAHKAMYIGLKVDLLDCVPDSGAVPTSEVMVIRSRDHEACPPEALLYYLRSQEGYEAIQNLVRGSTAHLYPADVQEMEVPSWGSESVTELIEAHRAAAEAFRAALLAEDRAADRATILFGPPT